MISVFDNSFVLESISKFHACKKIVSVFEKNPFILIIRMLIWIGNERNEGKLIFTESRIIKTNLQNDIS